MRKAVALALAALVTVAVGGCATHSQSLSGTIGDPTVDPAAGANPGAWLRYSGNPAPAGFSHHYQWAGPRVLTVTPELVPVTMTGTLDLTDRVPGATALLGFLDGAGLRSGDDAYQTGAYVYMDVVDEGVVIFGPSDGNDGTGEIVQDILLNADLTAPVPFTLTVDGRADPATCATDPADVTTSEGCLTLQIGDLPPLTDSYGTLTTPGEPVEFAQGAVPGWDSFTEDGTYGATGIRYDVTVDPVVGPGPAPVDS